MSALDAVVKELHDTLQEVENHPDMEVQRALGRLLTALLRLHAAGVERLASLALSDPDRARVALSDPLVANLLQLYGVTDGDGGTNIVEVLDGRAREGATNLLVRLNSGDTVSFVPEENVRRLERRAKAMAAPSGPDSAPPRGRRSAATIADLDAEGGLMGRLVHGYPVLLVRGDGEVRAYRNTCPGSLLPLHLGAMKDGKIHCPWHGCRFEPTTGRRVDSEGEPLQALELWIRDGEIEVELP